MEFLRRLLSRRPLVQPVAIPLPDFPRDPTWFKDHEGLPYPEWLTVFDWIDNTVAEPDHPAMLDQVVRLWLTRFTEVAGDARLVLAESPHFILLSPFPAAGRKWVLSTLETARRSLTRQLGSLAWDGILEKTPVLILGEDLYHLYISHYFPGDYMGLSSGVMITGGDYSHIAALAPPPGNFSDTPLLRTLTHELTHHALTQLSLPRWLNEALAMSFEDQLAGSETSIADRLGASFEALGTRALLQEFAAWWTEERLQGFWNGRLWNSEDDEQAFCYEMSRILFRLLTQSSHHAPDRLRQFIRAASWIDAGESAAQQHLGLSLGDAASDFLGDGNWTPDPARWVFPEGES